MDFFPCVFVSAVIFVGRYFVLAVISFAAIFSVGIFFAELLLWQRFFRKYFFAGILEADIFSAGFRSVSLVWL